MGLARQVSIVATGIVKDVIIDIVTQIGKIVQTALGGLLQVLYRGGSIPATVDATHIFAPHWLFCVKQPFQSALINYNGSVNFVNGVGTLADPFGIGRYIFQVTSIGATLLWQNPYSALSSGTSYPFTYSWGGGVGTIIMTGIAAGWNGPLQVIYSTQNGPMLTPGDPYEAWPDWRTLAPGEIDSACDTYNWAYRAYLDASTILGGQWTLAAADTLAQAAIVYDINDSRDWIKPTYTGSPFSDGSRFSYTDRTPTAPTFSCDAAGNVVVNVPAGSGQVQYGNAAINDTYNSGDYTYFYVGSNVPMTVGAFIDPAETYVPANRYTATLTLHGTGIELISINNTIFFNPAGEQLPAGTPVYTVGFIDTFSGAHTLWISRVRQLPPLPIEYYPGAIPFTANFLGQPATLVDWRGPVYMGYQSPWMWKQIGNATATANCVQMLADAQTQWHVQTGQPDTGPFAPVFYFERSDAVQYGPANTFGWSGPDPSTNWGGYQYRPLAELTQLVAEAAGTESYFAQAVSVADTFLTFLDNHWTNATAGPPTDYFQGQAAQVNYQDPQMAALILRALLYMDKQKLAERKRERDHERNLLLASDENARTVLGALSGHGRHGRHLLRRHRDPKLVRILAW